MTILLAATRPGVVAIAADRLAHDENGPIGEHIKVRVHEQLTLVAGSSGFAFHNETPLMDLVMQRLSHLTVADLRQALKEGPAGAAPFHNALRDLMAPVSEAARNAPPGFLDKARLDIRIGYVVFGRERLWRVNIGATTVTIEHYPWQLGGVNTIGDFYERDRFHDLAAEVMRADVGTADQLSAHLRDIVQAGIEEERRVLGANRDCGGPVDVAVVDRHGARLLPGVEESAPEPPPEPGASKRLTR